MSHLKTHPICSNNTSCTSNNTKRRPPCNENGHGCCQACLPCVTELVLPCLQTRQQSLNVTLSIQTRKRCMYKAFQHFAQIPSGARSFTVQMHWDRMQSNGFGRLHSNGYGHNWAVATDVTKIRCYSPGGMHCSL